MKKSPQIEGEHASFASGCVELLPLLEEPMVCQLCFVHVRFELLSLLEEPWILCLGCVSFCIDFSSPGWDFEFCVANHLCVWMLSIKSSRGRSETKLIRTLVYLWWSIDKWQNGFECFWDCMKLLSLLFDSSVVFSFCPFFENREFLLGALWSFLISSGLVFAFIWLLGTLVRVFFPLLLNLLLCTLVLINAFIKGKIERPIVHWSHPCVMNDWHKILVSANRLWKYC